MRCTRGIENILETFLYLGADTTKKYVNVEQEKKKKERWK